MKKISILIICFFIAGCSGQHKDTEVVGKINWTKNYSEAYKIAKESSKPVMIFFTASWCPYCIKLGKEVFTDDYVAEISEKFVNIFIDIDKDLETAKEFSVKGVPTILFIDPGKNINKPYLGNRTAKDFAEKMKSFLKEY